MKKILEFVAKHNIKITAITILIPIFFQLKAIFLPPIVALYDKLPSFSRTYDAILSIRGPFSSPPKIHPNAALITEITDKYQKAGYSAYSSEALKFVLIELLDIPKQNPNSEPKIMEAIDKLTSFDISLALKILNENYKNYKAQNKPLKEVKFLGLIAIVSSLKDPIKAVKIYNQALAVDKTNIFILNNMGQLYLENEDYENAAELFNQIINISKRAAKPEHTALGYNNLGVLYLKQDKFLLAQKNFETSLNIYQKYQLGLVTANQYTNLAIIFEKLDDIEKACSNYRKARIIYYKNYQEHLVERTLKKLEDLECL